MTAATVSRRRPAGDPLRALDGAGWRIGKAPALGLATAAFPTPPDQCLVGVVEEEEPLALGPGRRAVVAAIRGGLIIEDPSYRQRNHRSQRAVIDTNQESQ
jgi:hypothetical protein